LGSALPLPLWARSAGEGLTDDSIRSRYDLNIGYAPFHLDGREGRATAVNGSVPAPLVHLREGDTVELNVTNSLSDVEQASIHWHGILVPFPMDGVPGVNFAGIPPGDTYHYRYTLRQSGTYWYHSHSAFQEQTGVYGPLIIDPKDGEPFDYDRDYAVVLSDWSFTPPETIFRNINISGDYYNYQKRTFWTLVEDIKKQGFKQTVAERMAWGQMRMMPVDLADVTGATYTYLMNGNSPTMNWTALFNPGETVRLRFIDAAAMSNFDVRIPGLEMEVVMVDGKPVKPVKVHEFRIGVAETYDVLVRPKADKPFTIFAESLDRSGYTRGTLSPQAGLEAPVPALRPRPVRTLEDIGMAGMLGGMEHGMHNSHMDEKETGRMADQVPGPRGPEPFKPPDNANVAMVVMDPKDRLDEPGIGLGEEGWKVLTYADLVSVAPQPYKAEVDREMTINITANMERYLFSFDGLKYSQHPGPYLFRHNERLRLWLVNHTMMEHPIHLHGMWMQLENGQEHEHIPYKHTILIKPGEKLSALITPIEKGDWAFHCHLLYHMDAGMFQVVRVA
jgi:CopA family copper-resistance protein